MKIVAFILVFVSGLTFFQLNAHAATIFTEDFESGTLDQWTIGGRQLAGTNIANVVTRYGSKMGHLYKSSFTEINFGRNFDYEPTLFFNFDMETNVTSQPPPAANYYGSAGVGFSFLDVGGNSLGSVSYLSATTNFPFGSTPTSHVAKIAEGILQHHSLTVQDMLSLISIDETAISQVAMRFNTYSSTYPYPSVTAELWVDNINTVPLPSAVFLFGSGLIGLIGLGRKWKR